ncbi:MAG: 1-acyl-sn-glycerol-3-phosphate acyltransferase [Deltaproteobacteria bacterium]|nr:1-acyl-sn-glycerol-3-phosphate acyltransferase [Deltaproteobacteria bacterium]
MGLDGTATQSTTLPPVAMHDRYGPFFRSFFAHYFDPIDFPAAALERIRSLADQGTLVYISRSASLLHFLYLNHICLRHSLPLARFVNGVSPVLFQPVGGLVERMRVLGSEDVEELDTEGEALEHRQLGHVLRGGESALLFLQQAATLFNPHAEPDANLLRTLIHAQQAQEKPIYLVPHLIMWDLHPEREGRNLPDAVFGEAEAPGFLRTLFLLLRNYRNAFVKVAEPINLRDFLCQLDSEGECAPDEHHLALHHTLQIELFKEVFDTTGPRIRPHAEYEEEILADARIQDMIQQEAGEDEARREALRKEAQDMVDEIAAEPRIRWTLSLNWALNLFWKFMLGEIVVAEGGFERIREAIRKSPVVFCPSHKSHVDYLIISQMCLLHRVPLPHIAAGVNLSFWPMGPIFRHSGAFFMRRSFKGNKLYPVVFRTYLRHVMREGFPIEFFIEGGRSRTGKLLGPRYGILSWLVEAFQEGTGEDVQFIPMSIDYEKIVESGSYMRELSGGDKKKEDVAGLLRSSKALRSKHGNVYVQVGEPISLREYMQQRGETRENLDDERRRLLVQSLAHRILYDINRVSTVTPSALVALCLLNHRRRGMAEKTLQERARWAMAWMRRRQVRFSNTLEEFERSLAEAAARFSRDGLVAIQDTGIELVYSAVERRRLALDYYRNNVIHHFVPAAIIATALESFTVEAVPEQALQERVRELSRLFKLEFRFRDERHFAEELEAGLQELSAEGLVKMEDGFAVKRSEAQDLRVFFRSILEHFLEAYWIAARSLDLLAERAYGDRDFTTRCLQLGDHLFVQGEIMLQESISREVIKNALQVFTERGAIESEPAGRKGNRLTLAEDWKDVGRRAALAAEIERYLNR